MRDIKRRIRSIQSTQKITKAMKMVAAAKLRKTQGKVLAARPYAAKLQEVITRLAEGYRDEEHPLLARRQEGAIAYVVFTGDRGLCGGYNANVIRFTESLIRESGEESVIVVVGKKAREYFRRRKYKILREYVDLGDDPHYTQARELAKELVNLYLEGQIRELNLVYSRFYSAIRQQPLKETLLPIAGVEGEEKPKEIDYIYEPAPKELLHILLPRYLETLVYRALLEAKTSEHGARMTAMDSASDNASEMIRQLTITFNRARQAAITTEISEIVAGASALE